jgi:MFS family permease
MSSIQPAASASSSSALSPFRHRAFAVIWGAVLVANIGAWMQNAASSWLMTALDSEPGIVALVQVATAFPMFLIGLPAGALADIFDRRRLLLTMETVGTLLTAGFAVLIMLDHVTPAILLAFVFLSSAAAASIAPAWQAIVPQLAGRKELPAAIALISTGVNISRAIGPALAGGFIAWWGLASPFWIYAVSNVGCIAALFWWRPPAGTGADLPPERFGNAIVVGLRHARYNPPLRATLLRAAGFFFFACTYWALLPLVARTQLSSGPELYGLLLGAIGIGAVVGALVLPRFKQWLGADRLVELGSVGTALALLLFGLARQPAVALTASALAGLSWIAVLATLNVSAQVALPEWVRGRGLAAYVTAMFGAMALGSLAWGEVASLTSLSAAHDIAAAGMLGSIPLLRRWKLQTGAKLDLTPSMHWPAPVLSNEIEHDRGPVLVTLEYRISSQDRDAFLAAIQRAAPERKRDGAYRWGVFEDVAQEGRWLETFMVDSWLEHIRQHQRVTNVDRALEQAVHRFLIDGPPRITHFIAPEAASGGDPGETLPEAEDARQRNRRTGGD